MSSFPEDLDKLRFKNDHNIDDIIRLVASHEKKKLLDKLRQLIQEKDSHNDIVAAETLSWALKQLLR
jgi:hypothetical protein